MIYLAYLRLGLRAWHRHLIYQSMMLYNDSRLNGGFVSYHSLAQPLDRVSASRFSFTGTIVVDPTAVFVINRSTPVITSYSLRMCIKHLKDRRGYAERMLRGCPPNRLLGHYDHNSLQALMG